MKRLLKVVGTVAFVGILAGWTVFLRPQYLGGSAGYVLVSGTSMLPRLHTGDFVVVARRSSYRVGDVVAYRVPAGEAASGRVVIHRIRGGSASSGYIMRGDNRTSNDLWRPRPKDIVGAKRFVVPGAGRAAATVLNPLGLGLMCGLATVVLLLPSRPLPRRRRNYGALAL